MQRKASDLHQGTLTERMAALCCSLTFTSTLVCSWILRIRQFYHLNVLVEKQHFSKRRKIPDFLLWLLTLFISGLKISHRRCLREDSEPTGCFTPADCLGLLQVFFCMCKAHIGWNWNYRILILVLIFLFISNKVPCNQLVLLRMGSCAGAPAGNTLPLEGRDGRRGRCSSFPPA